MNEAIIKKANELVLFVDNVVSADMDDCHGGEQCGWVGVLENPGRDYALDIRNQLLINDDLIKEQEAKIRELKDILWKVHCWNHGAPMRRSGKLDPDGDIPMFPEPEMNKLFGGRPDRATKPPFVSVEEEPKWV